MENCRSIESIVDTFVRHLELLQDDIDGCRSTDRDKLATYVVEQYEAVSSSSLSASHLPSLFRSEFPKAMFQFMLTFLDEHVEVPSTPPSSPGPSTAHDNLNYDSEQEDAGQEDDPVNSGSVGKSEDGESDTLLDTYLVSPSSGDTHQPAF